MTTQERAAKTFAVYEKARAEKGFTDYYVSRKAAVRPAMICDWKHSRYTPKMDKLIVIAEILDIPASAFVEAMV